MEKLSDKIFLRITSYLNTTELLKCCLVSKCWRNIINKKLNAKKNLCLMLNSKKLRHLQEGKVCLLRKYRSVCLSNYKFDNETEYNFTSKLPHLERVIFTSCLFENIEYFKQSLINYKKVKIVEIYGAELYTPPPALFGPSHLELLPSSKPSKLSLDYFKFEMRSIPPASKRFNNAESWELVKLCKLLSINLTRIDLAVNLDLFSKFEQVKEMLMYYHTNYPGAVKSLTFCSDSPHRLRTRKPRWDTEGNEYVPQTHTEDLIKELVQMKGFVLDKFAAESFPEEYKDPLQTFLKQQPQLTNFALTKNVSPYTQINYITEHLPNLVELNLTFDDYNRFKTCLERSLHKMYKLKVFKLRPVASATLSFTIPRQLEELYIHADMAESYRMRPGKLKLMPSPYPLNKMRIFSMENVRMSSNRLQEVFEKMPNLTYFKLQDLQGGLPARALCGYTIYGHLRYSLKNLNKLETLCLDGRMLKDYVVMEIRAPALSELTISYEKNPKQRILKTTEVGLQYLSRECPWLKVIKDGRKDKGKIIYRRNKVTGIFERRESEY